MNKPTSILLAIAAVAILALWIEHRPKPAAPKNVEVSQASPVETRDSTPPELLPGDEILADYGSENLTPLDDVRMMHHAITNFRLLNHHIDARFFSTNRDVAEILRGKEGISHPFLSSDTQAISPEGTLIDRWGNPLFFHLQSAKRLDIRSAGPDSTMFTEDDVLLATP